MEWIQIVGATLRLTRLVVTDDLGRWWIKDPIDRAAERWYEGEQRINDRLREAGMPDVPEHPPQPWWWKYRSGLDCAHCAGFWIGAGVVAVDAFTKRSGGSRGARAAWRLTTAALSLGYVVGHVSSRLDAPDDTDPGTEE